MAGLLRGRRSSTSKEGKVKKEKKGKKKKDTLERTSTSKDRRDVLHEMSRGNSSSAFQGLLSEGSGAFGQDDEELSRPISFNHAGAKRYTYGSHQADVRGSTSLGVGVSKFTSCVKHSVEMDDTWTRLSLKYSMPMDDIRRFNKMYSTDEPTSRKELLIPVNDENRDKVDASLIVSMASIAAARVTTPEVDESPADAGPAPAAGADDPSTPPVVSKPSASDFLAQFDSKFGKTKSSVLQKSDQLSRPDAPSVYGEGASGRTHAWGDKRIGNGIKGDTAHLSYQSGSRR
eukprot:m.83820 g.83820  ORF g.83820 m.83820 type:complete len:288 (-) comp9561_c0_seq3:958-1821(-)